MDSKDILAKLNAWSDQTLMEVLGIRFTEFDGHKLVAEMPVDHRHHQPYGLLHGGASLALAETIGSSGSALFVDTKKFLVVGLQMSGNHLKSVRSGTVKGIGTLIHKGQSTHLWQIDIRDTEDNLLGSFRLTNFIKPVKK